MSTRLKIDFHGNSLEVATKPKPSKSNTNLSKVKKESIVKRDDLNIVKDLDLFSEKYEPQGLCQNK